MFPEMTRDTLGKTITYYKSKLWKFGPSLNMVGMQFPALPPAFPTSIFVAAKHRRSPFRVCSGLPGVLICKTRKTAFVTEMSFVSCRLDHRAFNVFATRRTFDENTTAEREPTTFVRAVVSTRFCGNCMGYPNDLPPAKATIRLDRRVSGKPATARTV
jgi:hypothetical protein